MEFVDSNQRSKQITIIEFPTHSRVIQIYKNRLETGSHNLAEGLVEDFQALQNIVRLGQDSQWSRLRAIGAV